MTSAEESVVSSAGGAATRQDLPAGTSRISRRQMMTRVSKGAVVAGVAAWVVPEILIATPSAAATCSQDPSACPPDSPQQPVPQSPSPSDGSNPTNPTNPTNPSNPTTPGGTTGGGPPTSPSGGTTVSTPVPATAALESGTGTGSTSGGGLPFTGFDALHDAEIGTAMIAGGWALKRWASRRAVRPAHATPSGDPVEDRPPQ